MTVRALSRIGRNRFAFSGREIVTQSAAYIFVNLCNTLIEAIVLVEVTSQLLRGTDSIKGVQWARQFLNDGEPLALAHLIILVALLPSIYLASSRLLENIVGGGVSEFRASVLEEFFGSSRSFGSMKGIDIPTRMGEIYAVSAQRIGDHLQARLRLASATISLCLLLTVALLSSFTVTSCVVIFLTVLAVILRPLRMRTKKLAKEWRSADSLTGEKVVNLARNTETISSFGVASNALSSVDSEVVEGSRLFGRLKASQRFVTNNMRFSVFLAILTLLAISQNTKAESAVQISVVFAIMLRCLQIVQEMVSMNQIVISEKPFEQEVAQWLHSLPTSRGHAVLNDRKITEYSWSKVSLVSDEGVEIFSGLSGSLKRGQMMALIGQSGSGKSTLLRVLAGHQYPSTGLVKINGISIHDCDQTTLVGLRSYLGQRNTLLTATVYENMDFFRNLPSSRLVDLAKAVRLHDELEDVNEGLTTLVDGANHSGLSGGQLQRILIAQTLAGSPSIIFLDEPTSALDSGGSADVVNLLNLELQRGAIVVVATHDEALANRADLVIHLGKGATI